MRADQIDAYRYFFPAGWILGIWGVLLWILFPWSLVQYPGLNHPEIMMGGFFLCFVCGFLMTAAPRFTSSFGPSLWEHVTAGALIGALFLSLVFPTKTPFFIVVICIFAFLAVYLFRRFLTRTSNPPDAFIFVGFGVLSGLAGSVLMALGQFFDVPASLYTFGRLLFLQTYILSLVLGVGSRLIPALLGWAPLPTELKKSSNSSVLKFAALALFFVLSYVIEVWLSFTGGQLLRALVISILSLQYWNVHKLPKRRAFQTWGLWVATWSLVLGQWGLVVLPGFRIHLLHVIFTSGLALMTFMIAVRVGLSHGHHEMTLEKNSKALGLGAFLIFFAGLTRLSAGFAPHIYQSHLIYAAYTWILGLLIWGWVFLPRICQVKKE